MKTQTAGGNPLKQDIAVLRRLVAELGGEVTLFQALTQLRARQPKPAKLVKKLEVVDGVAVLRVENKGGDMKRPMTFTLVGGDGISQEKVVVNLKAGEATTHHAESLYGRVELKLGKKTLTAMASLRPVFQSTATWLDSQILKVEVSLTMGVVRQSVTFSIMSEDGQRTLKTETITAWGSLPTFVLSAAEVAGEVKLVQAIAGEVDRTFDVPERPQPPVWAFGLATWRDNLLLLPVTNTGGPVSAVTIRINSLPETTILTSFAAGETKEVEVRFVTIGETLKVYVAAEEVHQFIVPSPAQATDTVAAWAALAGEPPANTLTTVNSESSDGVATVEGWQIKAEWEVVDVLFTVTRLAEAEAIAEAYVHLLPENARAAVGEMYSFQPGESHQLTLCEQQPGQKVQVWIGSQMLAVVTLPPVSFVPDPSLDVVPPPPVSSEPIADWQVTAEWREAALEFAFVRAAEASAITATLYLLSESDGSSFEETHSFEPGQTRKLVWEDRQPGEVVQVWINERLVATLTIPEKVGDPAQ